MNYLEFLYKEKLSLLPHSLIYSIIYMQLMGVIRIYPTYVFFLFARVVPNLAIGSSFSWLLSL